MISNGRGHPPAYVLRPVRSMADIERNREQGLVSALLTVEDGVELDGRLERNQGQILGDMG